MDETERKDAILRALLPDVPFDGWTAAAMRQAAARAGVAEGELAALFPRGPRDAVHWFSHWADRMMLETMAVRPLEGLKLGERIALAVRTRIELLLPHREAVRRGLSFLALPANAGLGLRLLYDTVDATWYAAGDAATDFSFYTKRAMLAGIYAATTLYWLDDRSEGCADTWKFLDRRLSETSILPKIRTELERVARILPNPMRLLRPARPRY
jgi:ubiquinone biosynthesis protein COQ9